MLVALCLSLDGPHIGCLKPLGINMDVSKLSRSATHSNRAWSSGLFTKWCVLFSLSAVVSVEAAGEFVFP